MELVQIGDMGSIAAKAYELIWSRASPDVYANLRSALSADRIHNTCVTEYRNFESQIHPLSVRIRVLKTLLPILLKHPDAFAGIDECNHWLLKRATAIFPEYSEKMLDSILSYNGLQLQGLPDPAAIENLSDDSIDVLKSKVESKRKELKETFEQEKVLDRALWFVKDGKMRLGFKDVELAEFVAERTLDDVPKREVKEDRIRAILRGVDLPEDRIEAVRESGNSAWYRVREPKTHTA